MRKIVSGLLVGAIVSSATVVSAAPPITLVMNGQGGKPDASSQIINGRAFVPVRAVAEDLGAAVKWDAAQRTVYVFTGEQKEDVSLEKSKNESSASPLRLVINGKEAKSEVPPQMINGRAWVPARELAEGLGSGVHWNASQRSIWITNKIVNPSAKDFNGQAMITFSYDDGLDTFYDFALPLHEKYGVPATTNIIAGRIKDGARTMYLDADQMKDMYDRGVEIGSHSYSHEKGLTTLSDEDLDFELRESKAVLEQIVPKVQTIGIPFSMYDERVKTAVKKYYQAARNFEHLQNDIPPADKLWMHSAIAVTNEMTFDQIKLRIDEAVKNKQWCIIMLHGIDPDNRDLYEIKPALLEKVLAYVASLGRDKILPVNTIDGVSLAVK
ncbi:stalk domain-containing protein [Brevibacillus sp. NRS-1366]|uniref:stalk domain-containing protein n=1 Tax=Brevibacillus sp. NRS-1366 TaxID=3233899 RepID=UPI003D196413